MKLTLQMLVMNLCHCMVVIISTAVRLRLHILTSRYYHIIWPLFRLSMYTVFFFYNERFTQKHKKIYNNHQVYYKLLLLIKLKTNLR